jgi:hypothetical protein
VILKSGQLRHHLPPPAPPANHPPQPAQVTTPTDIATPPVRLLLTEAASDDDSTEFPPEEFPDTEADIIEIGAFSTSSDDEEEANPLELPTASFDSDDSANADHQSIDEDVAEGVDETGENPGGIVGDLEDKDVHKTKWNKYVAEKRKLIDNGFVAEVKPRQLPPKQKGARVQEVSDPQLAYLFLREHTVLLI